MKKKNPGGRPKLDITRSQGMHIRFSPVEYDKLLAYAARAKLPPSVAVREIVLEKLGRVK